jgi:hypothetical protein
VHVACIGLYLSGLDALWRREMLVQCETGTFRGNGLLGKPRHSRRIMLNRTY